MNEERLVDIEIKLTRQEDLVDTLNRTVFRQQQKIDELSSLCTALASRIRELQQGLSDSGAANERPPHY
ncbi:SlyX family protein [Lacisediminimonas sp.]|uniref:SlyX family protein n=1 Tax=Lacisediminimonas sp. TaxID=3060582 RepID=UPI00271A8378|nr:SlyX family protein [Lacisediminimonas sp.]MDO8298584.1 SlyX family protein [Lacisediminimonas sp.]MDO9217766.1 SlyX family protein [Lacisediminimonas sp.]